MNRWVKALLHLFLAYALLNQASSQMFDYDKGTDIIGAFISADVSDSYCENDVCYIKKGAKTEAKLTVKNIIGSPMKVCMCMGLPPESIIHSYGTDVKRTYEGKIYRSEGLNWPMKVFTTGNGRLDFPDAACGCNCPVGQSSCDVDYFMVNPRFDKEISVEFSPNWPSEKEKELFFFAYVIGLDYKLKENKRDTGYVKLKLRQYDCAQSEDCDSGDKCIFGKEWKRGYCMRVVCTEGFEAKDHKCVRVEKKFEPVKADPLVIKKGAGDDYTIYYAIGFVAFLLFILVVGKKPVAAADDRPLN